MEHNYVVWYHFDGGMTNAFRCKAKSTRQAQAMVYRFWKFWGDHKREEIIVTGVDRED